MTLRYIHHGGYFTPEEDARLIFTPRVLSLKFPAPSLSVPSQEADFLVISTTRKRSLWSLTEWQRDLLYHGNTNLVMSIIRHDVFPMNVIRWGLLHLIKGATRYRNIRNAKQPWYFRRV